MFELLLERCMEERRQTVGFLASVIVNSAPFRSGNAKAVTALDFFPDRKQQEEEAEEQSGEQQESMLRAFFSRFKKKTNDFS